MKHLAFVSEEVTTKDADDDPQKSTITYAVVDDTTVGLEIAQRNGEARILRKDEVVVPATTNTYDVFSKKEWESIWSDTERVVTAATDKAATSAKSS